MNLMTDPLKVQEL